VNEEQIYLCSYVSHRDQEIVCAPDRCPPKAKVTPSNRVGRANSIRCTRPRQTVTPPHLAATQRVDRSTVRGVELSGALLEADAVVIAMGALVADGRHVVGSCQLSWPARDNKKCKDQKESVVTSIGRALVSTRKQSPDVIKHRSIV
jgi:hypothetical protein